MTQTTPEVPTRRRRVADAARRWWTRLAAPPRDGDGDRPRDTRNPGALAQLRRSRSSPEAMRVREGVALALAVGAVPAEAEAPDWRVRAAVDLARVLAHVKQDDAGRHPMQAAGWQQFPGERREADVPPEVRPRLSETRFRRLLQTADGEEKVAAFVRLVALLDGAVDVGALAADFLDWNHPEAGDRVRERWAFLYYAAGAAAPPSIDRDLETEHDG